MEKRVTFNERWLPYLLVAPQMIITLVFFFWPSSEAAWQSLLVEDAFGGHSKFVWFQNFVQLFQDDAYFDSVRLTLVFSALVVARLTLATNQEPLVAMATLPPVKLPDVPPGTLRVTLCRVCWLARHSMAAMVAASLKRAL